MMRGMLIASAMVAAVATGLIHTPAAARGGGGGGRGGFGGMGGMGVGSPSALGHAGGFGGLAVGRPLGFRGDRFAFRRGPLFRDRFAFFGGYPYFYDDGCYSRLWTASGWRLTYVCY